ncbi:uncharacterized protein LOC143268417 [Peromyscus maniculatus bairdii]|uniref:uncharacterized protein LOC143268417 n=1 Tax=Peromyscus maniculatus bairdii TaxID=230844 RepID=UPI003FD6AB38
MCSTPRRAEPSRRHLGARAAGGSSRAPAALCSRSVPRDTPGFRRAPHLRAKRWPRRRRRRTSPRGTPPARAPGPARSGLSPRRRRRRRSPPAARRSHCHWPGSARGSASRRHFPASPRSWEVSELLSALKEEEQWGGAFRFSLLPFYWLLDDFYSLSLIQEETAESLGELHY